MKIRAWSIMVTLGMIAPTVGCVELRASPGVPATDAGDTGIALADAEPTVDTNDSSVVSAVDSAPDLPAVAQCGSGRGTCNIVTSAGCPSESGCYPVNGDGSQAGCYRAGVRGWGSPCTYNTDCQAGFRCDFGHICRKMCCPNEHSSCQDTSTGGRLRSACLYPEITMGYSECVETGCNPYATTNNGCLADLPYCAPVTSERVPSGVSFYCTEARTPSHREGESCFYNNDCMPGFLCARPDAGGRACARMCSPSASTGPGATCGSSMRCIMLDSRPDLGICVRLS